MCIHPIKLIARVLRDWGRDSEVNVLAREAKGSALLKQPQTWNVVCEFFFLGFTSKANANDRFLIILLALFWMQLCEAVWVCLNISLRNWMESSKLSFIKIKFTYIAKDKFNLGQKEKVASVLRRQEEIFTWGPSKLFHVFNWSSVKKIKRMAFC